MGREVNRFRWLLITSAIVVGTIVIYCTDYSVGETGISILNTLARAQAAIFAIVFSVLILGVRLSASRYSPRLASAFSSDPAYRWTVGVFGVSIGFDIAVLYFFNTIQGIHLSILILIATGLAFGAFWMMWDFVNVTLYNTTPEGIVERLEEVLTTESIIEEAHDAEGNPTNADPFLNLLSVIGSFINDGDVPSASAGLEVLREKITELLQTAPPEEFEEDSPVDLSLENVCVNRLPRLCEDAIEAELQPTAREIIETSEGIGESAIEENLDRMIEHIVRGLSRLTVILDYHSLAENIRSGAIKKARELLKSATDEGVWTGAARGVRLLGTFLALSITNRTEAGYSREYDYTLNLCFPKVVSKVVDSNIDLVDHQPREWMRVHGDNDIEEAEMLVGSCYSSMTELTASAIRYEQRIDHELVRWQQVGSGWAEGLEALLDSNLESLTEIWLATIFYLEYVKFESSGDVMNRFHVRGLIDIDSEFAQSTIDKVIEGNIDPRQLADLDLGGIDPLEHQLTGSRSPLVSDPQMEFDSWLRHRRQTITQDSGLIESDDEGSQE